MKLDPTLLGRRIVSNAMRFDNLREIKPNTLWDNPITKGHDPVADELVALMKEQGWQTGWAYCYTGDIEFLSENGWVRFDSIGEWWAENKCRVIQINDNNHAELVEPTDFIRKIHTGKLTTISHRDIDITTDSEHRFWGSWRRGPLELKPVSHLTSELSIPPINDYATNAGESALSDRDLEFIAAYIADGYRHNKRGRENVEFRVSMPRKIARLAEFGPHSCQVEGKIFSKGTKKALTRFTFHRPSFFEFVFNDAVEYKKINWSFLFSLSSRQHRVFLDACQFWSGGVRGSAVEIRTARREHANIFVASAALAGYQAKSFKTINKHGYNIGGELWHVKYCRLPDRGRHIDTSNITHRDTDGTELYCITVPKGKILIRDRSGSVYICGNCAAFVDAIWCLSLKQEGATLAQIVAFTKLMQLGVMNSVRAFRDQGLLSTDPGHEAGTIWLARHGSTPQGHTGILLAAERQMISTIEANTSKDAASGDRDREGDWITRKLFSAVGRGQLRTQGFVHVSTLCQYLNR